VAAARRHARLPYVIAPDITALLEELHAGRPVLVLQNLGTRFHPLWHYAVVVGYRPDADQIILRSGATRRQLVRTSRFLQTWRRADLWGLVVLRPGELPARPRLQSFLHAVAELESTGQTMAARLAYAAATRRWPTSPTAWLGLGNTEYRLGDMDEAERSYRQAIRADRDYSAAYNNLAEVLSRRGCFDTALAVLDAAMTLTGAAAGELRVVLGQTRREILARRPAAYSGDPLACAPPVRSETQTARFCLTPD